MKIDKSTALFLTKVLFHYEQLVKESLSSDNNLADRVRVLRGELNDNLLAEDKCPNCIQEDEAKEEDDHQLDDEVEPDWSLSIQGSELANLTLVKTDYFGKIGFMLTPSHRVNIFEPVGATNVSIDNDVRYIKRTGNSLFALTFKELKNCREDELDLDNHNDHWEYYNIPKFPRDWTNTLKCGLVYKCV